MLGLTTTFCTKQTIHLHHPTLLASIFENSNEHVRGSAGWHARDAIRPRCPRADSNEGSSHTTSKYQSDDRVVCLESRSLRLRWKTGVIYTLRDNTLFYVNRATDQHRLNRRRANRLIIVQCSSQATKGGDAQIVRLCL